MTSTTQKALQTVINRAWEDASFKAAFIENPKKVFNETTGLTVSPEIDLVILDQTNPKKTYITIPPKPDFDSMELSDEELDQVAGGEVVSIGRLSLDSLDIFIPGGGIVNLDGRV